MATKIYPAASLYVGDLLPEVPEGLLYDVFNAVGTVSSIRVCRENSTRQSLGYAYVNFSSAQDAERALQILNNTPIKDKPCRIMWVQRDPSVRRSPVGNVFIKNLDPSIKHKELFDMFSDYGNILSVKVVLDKNGESKGYGFVHYDNAQNAQKAIDALNNKTIGVKRVYVGNFVPKKELLKLKELSWTNVYIKDIAPEVTLEELKKKFSEVCDNDQSHLTSCVIMTKPDGTSKEFGFVNYDKHEYAVNAVETLNSAQLGSKKIFCARAQKLEERKQVLKKKEIQWRMSKVTLYQGRNLYVKNLDEDFTEERLNKEFSAIGPVVSCKLAINPQTGLSKQFGFVCYQNPEDATKAISEFHGQILQGCTKPLYVALHELADVRRPKLAQMHMRGPAMYSGQWHNYPYPAQVMRPYPNTPYPQRGRGKPHPRSGGRTQGSHPRHQQTNQPSPQPRSQAPFTLPSLSLKHILALNPKDQRQALGELLYRAIQHYQEEPYLGKITGMLIDSTIPVPDLYALLSDEVKLKSQIDEAMRLLPPMQH